MLFNFLIRHFLSKILKKEEEKEYSLPSAVMEDLKDHDASEEEIKEAIRHYNKIMRG